MRGNLFFAMGFPECTWGREVEQLADRRTLCNPESRKRETIEHTNGKTCRSLNCAVTSSTRRSLSSEANSRSASKNIRPFMESENSLPNIDRNWQIKWVRYMESVIADVLDIQRMPEDLLNRHSRITDKGWSCIVDAVWGMGLTIAHHI
jgi:hypothetical protein